MGGAIGSVNYLSRHSVKLINAIFHAAELKIATMMNSMRPSKGKTKTETRADNVAIVQENEVY